MFPIIAAILSYQIFFNTEEPKKQIPGSVAFIPNLEIIVCHTSGSIILKDLKNNLAKEILITGDLTSYIENSTPLALDSTLYFISNSDGFVFKLNDDRLIRVDKSYNHKSQLMSSLFTYEKKIYRYGGYGFFDARNFFTCFDSESNEWEVLIIKKQILPTGSFNSKFFVYKNYFYTIGGKAIDPFNRTESYVLNEVWRFNLNEKTWEHLLDLDYFETLTFSKNDFVIDDKFYFKIQNQLYAFNTKGNNFEKIEKFPLIEKLVKNYSVFATKDSLHYFTSSSNESKQIILNKYPLSEHLQVEKKIFPSQNNYLNVYFIFHWIAGILFIILIIFVLKKILKLRSSKLITIKNHSMILNKKRIEIDEIELQILKLFNSLNPLSIIQIINLFEFK